MNNKLNKQKSLDKITNNETLLHNKSRNLTIPNEVSQNNSNVNYSKFANETNNKSNFLSTTSKLFESKNINSSIFTYRLDVADESNISKYNLNYLYNTNIDETINQLAENAENETQQQKSFVHKDGGMGWIVVIASCWCFGIVISMQNSYSLLYNSIIEKYKNSTNPVSYAGENKFKNLKLLT